MGGISSAASFCSFSFLTFGKLKVDKHCPWSFSEKKINVAGNSQ
jgi:hypothetical protein